MINKKIIGVTGKVGSGKSFYCKKVQDQQSDVGYISVDHILHECQKEKKLELVSIFGDDILDEDG